MKPFFLKKKSAWYSLIITGIIFVGIGLFQMTMSINEGKNGPEGLPPGLAADGDRMAEKGNLPGSAKGNPEEAAVEGEKTGLRTGKEQIISEGRPNDFFVEYRLERDRTRSQQVDWLREIVNNQNSLEESKKEAQLRLLKITKTIETEMQLENLLKAENFKDAIVVSDEKSVTIIVQVPVLTPVDKNKIVEITSRITGFDAQHIKVIPKV